MAKAIDNIETARRLMEAVYSSARAWVTADNDDEVSDRKTWNRQGKFDEAVSAYTLFAQGQALRFAADEVHREARWQEERRRGLPPASQTETAWFVQRLLDLEQILRDKASEFTSPGGRP